MSNPSHALLVITCAVLLAYSIAATIVVILNNKEHQTCSDAAISYHDALIAATVKITELERDGEIALVQRDKALKDFKEARAALATIHRLLNGVVIDGGVEARKEAEKYLLSHPDAPKKPEVRIAENTKGGVYFTDDQPTKEK